MSFSIGDKVLVVDEELEGIISAIDSENIHIKCADDFEYCYQPHQLLKTSSDGPKFLKRTSFDLNTDWTEKKKESNRAFNFELLANDSVFDLHIDELAGNQQFNTKHDVLIYQLDFVREVIELATLKRIRKLHFVHGIGKGILKRNLREMLSNSFPHIEYFDASYQKFGQGATSIIIHEFKID